MTLKDVDLDTIRTATALVTAAMTELEEGRKIGDAPPPGFPGIDAMIAETGDRLPAVASSLVGVSVALLIGLSRATGKPPLVIWQGYLQDAEQRRTE